MPNFRLDVHRLIVRTMKICAVALVVGASAALAQEVTAEDSRAKAAAEFPDLSNPSSVFARAYAAEEAQFRKTQPNFFANSNWPLMLAYCVATKLGVNDASATSNEDPNADADLVRGEQFYTLRDYKGAFNHYSKAAARGVPAAQRLLAQMWEIGRGTPRAAVDKREAERLYREAARNGDRIAQEMLDAEENARINQEQAFQEMRAKAFAPRMRANDRRMMERAVAAAGFVRSSYEAGKLNDEDLNRLYQQALPILEIQGLRRDVNSLR